MTCFFKFNCSFFFNFEIFNHDAAHKNLMLMFQSLPHIVFNAKSYSNLNDKILLDNQYQVH